MKVERELVEAYFQSNGFLVRQVGEPLVESGKRKPSPLPSLAVFNPSKSENTDDLNFRIYSGDLGDIRSALVSLLGWGNSSFASDCLSNDNRLLKFFKNEIFSERLSVGLQPSSYSADSGMGSYLRLLVVPGFPRDERKIKSLTENLKNAGVDGVLTLRSIIENLLRQSVGPHASGHHGSVDLFKLLKAYNLVKEPQLDMFED